MSGFMRGFIILTKFKNRYRLKKINPKQMINNDQKMMGK